MKLSTLCLCLLSIASLHAEKPTVHPDEAARQQFEKTGYRGTVLIYDFEKKTYFASHPEIADERFSPASTFKILSTQAALQSGVVANKDSVIEWDGIERRRTATNQDLNLTAAFRISAVPHYQGLVRKIGASRMQAFVDSIPYGNQKISGGIDQFWLTGDLRISPREQIEFLVRLYQNKLPFDPSVMTSVKEMMLAPKASETTYSAKTGWATLPENRNIGWWVGWAERHDRHLFFATVLDSSNPDSDFGKTRIELTQKVLDLAFSH